MRLEWLFSAPFAPVDADVAKYKMVGQTKGGFTDDYISSKMMGVAGPALYMRKTRNGGESSGWKLE